MGYHYTYQGDLPPIQITNNGSQDHINKPNLWLDKPPEEIILFKLCSNCRYDLTYDQAGKDCQSCHDSDRWKPLKNCDDEKCVGCEYEDDPCHYECINCSRNRNYIKKEETK